MAFGKLKDTWFIWALLIVAAVFAVMALSGTRPKEQMVPINGPLVTKAPSPAPVQAAPTVGIKPDHSATDMKEISTKKPAESVVLPPQAVPSKDRFAVQVYSFKEKTRAEAALKTLKEKSYKAYIMVSDLGSRGVWYRVRIGAFASEEEARKVLESITKDFKSGIIVSE